MRIAIVGARDFGTEPNLNGKPAWEFLTRIFRGIEKRYGKVTIVSGGARGVDRMAAWMARDRNHTLIVHEAEWDRLGKSAGYKRNELIVADADMVVAILRPGSKGTRHTIHIAMEAHKPVRMFDAATGDEFNSCPCDDDETHTRLKNESTYQTVLIDGRDEVLAGEDPRVARYELDADAALELLPEGSCSTCGREAPEGNCLSCAREVYGDAGLDRYGIERNARTVTPNDDPDITGHNYYTTPDVPDWEPNPFLRGTFYRIVNGYKLFTVENNARISKERLLKTEAHLRSLKPGPHSTPVVAPFGGVKVAPEQRNTQKREFVRWTATKSVVKPELPDTKALMAANAAILANKAASAFKGGATFQVLN